MIPEDLKYTTDHEWVRIDGDVARIGITHYAQESLGDIVFVQQPDLGDVLEKGKAFGEVESTKSVSDLYAPVAGEVVTCNEALQATPELVNSDPYGEGWILEVRLSDGADTSDLLDPQAYAATIEQG